MLRKISAVVVGLIAGVLVIAGVEAVSSILYPPPAGIDFNDRAQVRDFVASLPATALVVVLAAHGAGSFVAGGVCALIVRRRWYVGAIGLGLFFMIMGGLNLLMIPHPLRFAMSDLALYVPCAWFGCWAAGWIMPGGAHRK